MSGAHTVGGAQPGEPNLLEPGGHTHAPFTHDAFAMVPFGSQQPWSVAGQLRHELS
jgi:hypothetical protein